MSDRIFSIKLIHRLRITGLWIQLTCSTSVAQMIRQQQAVQASALPILWVGSSYTGEYCYNMPHYFCLTSL